MKENDDLDVDQLRDLLKDTNNLEISNHEIHEIHWPMYRIDHGFKSRDNIICLHSIISQNVLNPTVQKLVNFLNIYITPELANNEKEEYSFYIYLTEILFEKLNKKEYERAIKTEKIGQPVDLNEKEMQDVIESQVKLCEYKKQGKDRIKLICTICPIEMLGINELIFIQNKDLTAKIRKWSSTERAIFASRYAYNVSWDFDGKSPMEIETFVEIEYKFSINEYDGITDNNLQQFLFDILDLIKWTIMVLSNNPNPMREGTSILTTCMSYQLETIQRDPGWIFVIEGDDSNFVVMPEMFHDVRALIKDFKNTLNEFNDLKNSLHFFGRACIAALNRDRLIESVIGLEIILVQGHEQLGYQFRLHGATIFSTQWNGSKISIFEGENELFWKREKLVEWFKKLYTNRSTSVHGSNKGYAEDYVSQAVYSLAVIIKGIVYLHKEGHLHDEENKLSRAVENYISNKSVLKNID